MSSQTLTAKLKDLKEARKRGDLNPREFYIKLLNLTCEVMQELIDEDISDEDVKKQIPLILAFIEDQIDKLGQRGH